MTTVDEVQETESADGLFDAAEADSNHGESDSVDAQAAADPVQEADTTSTDDAPPPVASSDDTNPGEFTFHPADGSDPITVASVKVAIPEGKQRWFFWKLRKLQGLEQPIFWLEQAGIPDHLQEQIMLLPDEEWSRFYEEWMRGGGASPGE